MERLAASFPPLRRLRRLPLTRDQFMLLMAAVNAFFLAFDHYLAHNTSGTIVGREWIPIFFEPIAGVLLLLAGLIALRHRPLATVIGSVALLASIGVGFLGAYYHLLRAILISAPAGEWIQLGFLVWAPPILGPLFLAFVGMVGISAVWIEDPPGSGVLLLLAGRKLRMPYSKTRAYFLLIGLGILATTLSSVLDHARTHFQNPWQWVPTAAGVFGTVVAVTMGALEKRRRFDLLTYVATMLLLMLVGAVGAVLHIESNLSVGGAIVVERFIRGAPLMAPLLFANMGLLGLLVLFDSSDQ
jgi:glucan phosphoethanolaminetransferase (alkaline phosphatase superfamily)